MLNAILFVLLLSYANDSSMIRSIFSIEKHLNGLVNWAKLQPILRRNVGNRREAWESTMKHVET